MPQPYNITLSGAANFSGAFIANTLLISGGASMHYDQALANFSTIEGSSGYTVGSWTGNHAINKRVIWSRNIGHVVGSRSFTSPYGVTTCDLWREQLDLDIRQAIQQSNRR